MGNKHTFKSFEEWCIENNRQDYLDLWDYSKNKVSPSEVSYGTKRRYYFNCPNGIHESETRRISNLTVNPNQKYTCKECGGNGYYTDLTGMVFGELTVLGIDNDSKKSDKHWLCECSCGEIVSVGGIKLRGGKKKICGKFGKHKHQTFSKKENKHSGTEYKYFKKVVKEKTNNVCIISGEQLDDNEIHHIFPYAKYPELRYNVNNGACIAKKYHSTACEGSFHRIYGTGENNTPENFQKYVNEKRRELGNYEPFDVYAYLYQTSPD